ncbi:hypothetical protein SBV1_2530012 [Verrucomicrobia bacterium]|nr:hypothetical protein SBV1_2530012 [Verrucomicrobiota bacterium]
MALLSLNSSALDAGSSPGSRIPRSFSLGAASGWPRRGPIGKPTTFRSKMAQATRRAHPAPSNLAVNDGILDVTLGRGYALPKIGSTTTPKELAGARVVERSIIPLTLRQATARAANRQNSPLPPRLPGGRANRVRPNPR